MNSRPPPKQQKKNTPPAETARKRTRPRPNSKKRTRPRPNSKNKKKKRPPPKQQKKTHTHPPKQQRKTRSEGAGACFFLLFGRGRFFFFLFERCLGPRPNSKKKIRPRPNSKKNNTRKAQTTKKTRQQKNKHSYRSMSFVGGGLRNWLRKGLGLGAFSYVGFSVDIYFLGSCLKQIIPNAISRESADTLYANASKFCSKPKSPHPSS